MDIIEYEKGMEIKPGMVISGMPIEIYHSKECSDYTGSTDVKNALVSYDNYEYWSGKSVLKYAYDFGNVFHSGMESQIENGDFSIWSDLVRDCPNKTTSAKFIAQKEGDPNSLFIHPDDKELIEKLINRTMETASEVNLLENGYCELSMFWEVEGIKCKCRPDFFRPDIGLCIDFKTCAIKTSDKSIFEQFKKDIANLGYHVSASFYAEGIRIVTGIDISEPDQGGFIFTVVQKSEPWPVNIFQLDNKSISEGYSKCLEGLQTIKNGPQETDIIEISLPGWAFTRE